MKKPLVISNYSNEFYPLPSLSQTQKNHQSKRYKTLQVCEDSPNISFSLSVKNKSQLRKLQSIYNSIQVEPPAQEKEQEQKLQFLRKINQTKCQTMGQYDKCLGKINKLLTQQINQEEELFTKDFVNRYKQKLQQVDVNQLKLANDLTQPIKPQIYEIKESTKEQFDSKNSTQIALSRESPALQPEIANFPLIKQYQNSLKLRKKGQILNLITPSKGNSIVETLTPNQKFQYDKKQLGLINKFKYNVSPKNASRSMALVDKDVAQMFFKFLKKRNIRPKFSQQQNCSQTLDYSRANLDSNEVTTTPHQIYQKSLQYSIPQQSDIYSANRLKWSEKKAIKNQSKSLWLQKLNTQSNPDELINLPKTQEIYLKKLQIHQKINTLHQDCHQLYINYKENESKIF